jgi:hypothetical protein
MNPKGYAFFWKRFQYVVINKICPYVKIGEAKGLTFQLEVGQNAFFNFKT